MQPPSRARRRPLEAAALALFLGLQAGCWEPPIREEVELQFLADGSAVVASRVQIQGELAGDNPGLARRLADARRALLAGDDDWSRRFAQIAPVAERRTWEKFAGELASVDHRALLEKTGEPDGLGRFFADTPLVVSYTVLGGTAELRILPGLPRPARGERQKVEARMAAWTPAIAAYLAAGKKLWRYLDDHPDRAEACFARVFSAVIEEREGGAPEFLPGDETRLAEALADAIPPVLKPLEVPGGEEASADELSHRVFDPFPAPIRVTLPGPALAVEGFTRGADGTLEARGPGLWNAFAGLEGRWLAPDPALHFLRAATAGPAAKQGLDLASFLRLPRRAAEPPTADEVKAALVARLRPASLYRVTFQVDPEADVTPPPPFGGASLARNNR